MTLESRARGFASALERRLGSEVAAVDADGRWAVVVADVPVGRVNKAQSVAGSHGFRLTNKLDGGGVGTGRYRFEAEATAAELSGGSLGGLGL